MSTSKMKSKLFLIFTGLLCFVSSGCDTSKNLELSLNIDDLVPGSIDNSMLQNIDGYDNFQKVVASTNKNVSAISVGNVDEEKSSTINGFKNIIGDLGELTFFGDSFECPEFDSSFAVGNTGRFLAFSYLQNIGKEYKFNDYKCNIFDCSENKIENYSIGTKARSGALVLLKSFDSTNWESEVYSTNINRRTIVFTPDGDDVYKGAYYKLLNLVEFRYLAGYKTTTTGILWWKETKEEPIYVNFRLLQEFDFFICTSSGNLRFECESTTSYSCEDSTLVKEEIELIQKSISMTNESVSTSYIDVDLLNPYASYTYSYEGKDGTDSGTLSESHRFTKPGKYEFESTNKLGKTQNVTLYIIDLGEDNGFSQFFGEGICDNSRRMFDLSKPLPVYMVGKQYELKDIPSYLPGRYGSIYYYKDENALSKNEFEIIKTYYNNHDSDSFNFEKQGYYILNFMNCEPSMSSGDVLQYTFSLYISNNIYYSPSVNYNLLRDGSRTNLLATKVYGVSLVTTGGGAYQFIFPYNKAYAQQAYELAVEIEELSVEIIDYNGEKCYFYKSVDNPFVKSNYINKVALYEAINKYADLNVSVVYLENDIQFATSIVEDDDLSNLVDKNLRNTVRVVSNENILKALQTTELYLNNFKFTQIADYEVNGIIAKNSNGVETNVPFDTSLDDLFSKNEKLEITEANWNGSKTYNAIYSKTNACLVKAQCNGDDKTFDITDDSKDFTYKTFKFISVNDDFDSQTLVAVSDGNTRSLFSMKEIEGLSLPKGDYQITLINRNQQTYRFKVKCTEEPVSETTSSFNHDPLRVNMVRVTDGNVSDLTQNKFNINSLLPLFFVITIVVTAGATFAITFFVMKSKNKKG